MNLVSIQNLGKSYRTYSSEWKRFASWFGVKTEPSEEHWVLQNINFNIQPGESIGIIGQNGAGKSTLLKLITGTLHPTEGSITVKGRIAAILELGMGFNPDLTGRQNVYHAAGLMGYTPEQIRDALPEIKKFAEIDTYFEEPVRTYSSGMQVRVAFAVATAFRPDILIIDEALSVGDAYFQAKCFERIISYKKQGTTLILVTHVIADIVKHCNRALYIKDGKLIIDGSPRDASNLYMDGLFGSHSNKLDIQDTPDTVSEATKMMTGVEDIFHTHPGYRKEEHRWGNGGARILDYLIKANGKDHPATIESNARAEFSFKVIFEKTFEEVTAGFLLKTHDGVFLYGTNSYLASRGQNVITAGKDEVVIFKFELPLNLNAGHYMVSFGISTGPQEALEPLDRRYDSVLLTIERNMTVWGLVDLQAEFSVTEEVINAT